MAELRPFTQTFQPANALMVKEKFEQERERHNWLRAQEMRAGETHESRMLSENAQRYALGISAALKLKDRKLQAKAFKKITKDNSEFGWQGKDLTIKFEDGGGISGPPDQVVPFLKDYLGTTHGSQDFLGVIQDPFLSEKLGELLSQGGITLDFGGAEEKGGSDFDRALKEHRRKIGPISSAKFRQKHWLKQATGMADIDKLDYTTLRMRDGDVSDDIFNLEEQLSILDPEDKETGGMAKGLKKRLKRRRNQQRIIRQRMRELDPNYEQPKSNRWKDKTPEDVRNAFINGELTEEEAAQILRSTFSYE